jgi:hypothetical protein
MPVFVSIDVALNTVFSSGVPYSATIFVEALMLFCSSIFLSRARIASGESGKL